MKTPTTALTLAIVMGSVSVAAIVVRPGAKVASNARAFSLDATVPMQFGEWTELPDQSAQVVNPQTKEALDKIYSQLLMRTYANKSGYRIMLALAYGDDQRGGLQAHLPEWCYPGQGFTLGTIADGTLQTAFGAIDVRRLETSLGARHEPVTYWLINGERVVKNSFDKRVEQIRLGLTGKIPDGLLFRVSSIDVDTKRGFDMQQRFTAELMAAVSPAQRMQLAALAPTPPDTPH